VVENALRDFRLAGVDLGPKEKTRYCEIAQRLAQLATKFSENVLDAGRAYTRSVTDGAELAGLPANAVDRAAADAREANQAGWLFKLDQPTYMTVMASAESSQLRRDIYEAWITRASEVGPSAGRFDNIPIIAEILPLRHELARLVGFDNFAEYALATRMAKSSKQVLAFLTTWRAAAFRRGATSFRIWRNLRAASSTRGTWRSTASGCRKAVSRCSQEALRPYFPLPKVLGGLFALIQRLYGITVRERPGVGRVAPLRALLRSARSKRAGRGRVLPGSVFARRESAAARGWTNASSPNPYPREQRFPWRSWYAISPRRWVPDRRC